MQRGRPGEPLVVWYLGDDAHTFIPAPLPPDPPIEWSDDLLSAYQDAGSAISRLESSLKESGGTETVPRLLEWLLHRDALIGLSMFGSSISLASQLNREAGYHRNGTDSNALARASNAIRAYQEGYGAIDSGRLPTSELMRQLHRQLAAVPQHRKYGGAKHVGVPGAFRSAWLWTGMLNRVTRPNMRVPPEHVATCMDQLDEFIGQASFGPAAALSAGLVHMQLDLIYPFVDDGPRLNTLISSLILRAGGVTGDVQLQLNEQIREKLGEYYGALDAVLLYGDWEQWLLFWFELLRRAALRTKGIVEEVLETIACEHDQIARLSQVRGSVQAVHDVLRDHPIVSSNDVQRLTGLATSTANKALSILKSLEIVNEATGYARNRVFCYYPLIRVLSDHTDEPARGPKRFPTVR